MKRTLLFTLSLSLLASPVFSDEERIVDEAIAAPFEQVAPAPVADNVAEPTPKGEHGKVGTDPLPADLKEKMDNERVEKLQEFKDQAEKGVTYYPKSAATSSIALSTGMKAQAQPVKYTYSLHNYHLEGVSNDARFIDLDDGSRWEIAPGDTYKVQRWRGDETYVITPNSNWLGADYYTYAITNQQRGSSAKAKLILGANTESPKAHWVINFDPHRNLVYLENGTVWQISEDDFPYYSRWKINHMVIVGNYYPWFYVFYPYDSILINVNMDHYVHARQR